MPDAKPRLPTAEGDSRAELLFTTLYAKAVAAICKKPLPVDDVAAEWACRPDQELERYQTSPASAPTHRPLPAAGSRATATAVAAVANPEVVARHLARLRRDLNNRHLLPAVRAGRLRQYRTCFYELAAIYFAHQQVPLLAAYMRSQQAALRRWTQELYGVRPEATTPGRPQLAATHSLGT